jgi:non-heme chloroperoxidase
VATDRSMCSAPAAFEHRRVGGSGDLPGERGGALPTTVKNLAELVEPLDLSYAVHVGHSTGGEEVTRYI